MPIMIRRLLPGAWRFPRVPVLSIVIPGAVVAAAAAAAFVLLNPGAAGSSDEAGVAATPSQTETTGQFRVCNTTGSLVGVALGHNGPDGWMTDGWWNLEPNTCRTLLRGDLIARYYYVYAIDYELGGEWSGESYMCTSDTMFSIVGIEECEARGYMRTGFFEVDTREQRSWTVRLTEPAGDGPAPR